MSASKSKILNIEMAIKVNQIRALIHLTLFETEGWGSTGPLHTQLCPSLNKTDIFSQQIFEQVRRHQNGEEI